MISYLKGQILHKDDASVIIQTNNIGYLVYIPKNVNEKIKVKDEIEFFIHTHVREDIFALYGFLSMPELTFFKLLLTVSGIGPKSALEIMSCPLSTVSQAILKNDLLTLTTIPGIGKKTAERLVLELKSKIDPTIVISQEKGSLSQTVSDEVITALTSLGYSRYQIMSGLKNIDSTVTKTEDIIRYFLKIV